MEEKQKVVQAQLVKHEQNGENIFGFDAIDGRDIKKEQFRKQISEALQQKLNNIKY